MKIPKVLVVAGLILPLALQSCRPSPAEPVRDTATPSPTPTLTASPTLTPTPSSTPTLTPTPTNTPTPTATPIIQTAPRITDNAEALRVHRPQLSGTVRYVDTRHFRIFYTMSGEDAVQVRDADGSGIPDYVEGVARALEHSWEVEINQLGWAPPPPDSGLGGDDRFDVYLEDLDMSIAGYVTDNHEETPSGMIGDNPRTSSVETTAAYSFMGLDNDFAEVDALEGEHISGQEFMHTTVAHEFNHALQYGYDSEEPHGWLWEATATWVQSYVYPEIKDAEFHLSPAFKSPDTCLLDYGFDRVESAGHWYAMWLFLRSMSEDLGPMVVRDIWQQASMLDGYDALDAALQARDTSLEEVYRRYTIALLLRNFNFALEYPTVRLEGQVEGLTSWAPNDGVGQTAADFVQIQAEGLVEISLWNLHEGTVVGIREHQADVYPLVDGKTTIDASQYDQVYLIVLNFARAEAAEDCRMTPYRVRVLKGYEPAVPQKTLSAEHFIPPSVEPLQPWE